MTSLGIRLTLLAGPTVPIPPLREVMESLGSVEITHSDEGRSGFQIIFQVGQNKANFLDYALLKNPQFQTLARVVVMVSFGTVLQVLIDGIITNQQFSPSNEPSGSTLTLTGEDISIMMDREERNTEHPAQSEAVIALKIIGQYAQYGLIPVVIPPPTVDIPTPIERIPTQQATDLIYLQELARRYNYVFYITPGLVPGSNFAYWGPLIRQGIPQKALSYNLGANSNVDTLNFQNDALSPTSIIGQVQDRLTNQTLPVVSLSSLLPALSANPPDLSDLLTTGREILRANGLNAIQAFAQAQARADASTNAVVTAEGELNTARYGGILRARSLVDLRGVGLSYSGTYYVKQVTHKITGDAYKQQFTLTREGLGAALPTVRV
ncbi:phage protein D [Nostoc piscinale CENA21]|uniref:Phage protein D n=1 Tax=Nostoc piscinale CENA21 TaxID=224013 RepID=A0A0M5MGN6_9NOSO|nr:hypothetical protein [Nostoc piscinale]ALF52892.1 phage protein D [Nostoc piscinale CENA21]